jgi:two-component system OmpR family response regulator
VARLLVVDDEQDILDLVVKRLRQDGHAVESAESGPAALVHVQRHGMPDAAVLDIDMPGMDGFGLLTRLRELRPALPAMFLTVLWHDDVHSRIRLAGVGYLAKPFAAADLAAKVREMILPARDVDAAGRSGL